MVTESRTNSDIWSAKTYENLGHTFFIRNIDLANAGYGSDVTIRVLRNLERGPTRLREVGSRSFPFYINTGNREGK